MLPPIWTYHSTVYDSIMVRGGSAIASAASLSSSSATISQSPVSSSSMASLLSLLSPSLSPSTHSVICMSIAMALHFFGYELARSATLTLFTSHKTGFQHQSAMPTALAFVFPASAGLLLLYTHILESWGPRIALRTTTVMCAVVLSSLMMVINLLSSSLSNNSVPNVSFLPSLLLPLFVSLLFIFRESYVSLLASQHWSFLGSLLTSSQGATWVSPIGGLSSAASALSASYAVSPLVSRFGITGLLFGASLALVISALFAERAFAIAEAKGFSPGAEKEEERTKKREGEGAKKKGKGSVVVKAKELFGREPALKALFLETLVCQGEGSG